MVKNPQGAWRPLTGQVMAAGKGPVAALFGRVGFAGSNIKYPAFTDDFALTME